MIKIMLSGAAALFLTATQVGAAEQGKTSATGASPSTAAGASDKSGPSAGDENLSSHSGPDAQMTKDPSKNTVSGATGDVGAAKRNKRLHGSSDSGKLPDNVKSSAKNTKQPAPGDSDK